LFASIQNAIFNNGAEMLVVVYHNSGGYIELLAQTDNQSTPEPSILLCSALAFQRLAAARTPPLDAVLTSQPVPSAAKLAQSGRLLGREPMQGPEGLTAKVPPLPWA
jgi:hypothetical protein